MTLKEEANKALSCLYIAVDESIADDVKSKVNKYTDYLEKENKRLQVELLRTKDKPG